MVFVLAFSARVYWIAQKQGTHIDEAATHIISTYSPYGWLKHFPQNTEVTGEWVKKTGFSNVTNHKENFRLLAQLRKDNNRCYDHTNLYYTLYRLWAVHAGEYFNLKDFIRWGCALNLVFFCLSFFFMYKLLRMLFIEGLGVRGKELAEMPGSYSLVPLGLAAAYLNTGSISNTLYIREYQLQEMLFVLLAWIFVVFCQKITCPLTSPLERGYGIISFKNFVVMSTILCFTLMSGGFAIIYAGMLGMALLAFLIKRMLTDNTAAKWRVLGAHAAFLLSTLAGALGMAMISYSKFYRLYSNFQSQGAIYRLLDFKSALKNILMFFSIELNFVFYLPVLLIILVCLCHKCPPATAKSDCLPSRNSIILTLIGLGVLWTVIVCWIMPFKILRYIMSAIPITAIAVPYAFSRLNDRTRRIFIPALLITYVVSIIIALPVEIDERAPVNPKFSARASIQNTEIELVQNCKFNKNPDLPVVIINNGTAIHGDNLLFYFNDKQKYVFNKEEDQAIYKRYKHFYLLLYLPHSAKIPNPPENYRVLDKSKCGFFQEYELIK
jgi:hypothetical protein